MDVTERQPRSLLVLLLVAFVVFVVSGLIVEGVRPK